MRSFVKEWIKLDGRPDGAFFLAPHVCIANGKSLLDKFFHGFGRLVSGGSQVAVEIIVSAAGQVSMKAVFFGAPLDPVRIWQKVSVHLSG